MKSRTYLIYKVPIKHRAELLKRYFLFLENDSNKSSMTDQSDEGTIVSGLTNLYLGRTDKNNKSTNKIPKSFISNYEALVAVDPRLMFKLEPYEPHTLDEDQHSFYQTETNRSNRTLKNSHFLNVKSRGSLSSFYQNNNNSASSTKSLQILKLFQ